MATAVEHVLSEFLLDVRDCPFFFATIDVQAPWQQLNVDLGAGLLPLNSHERSLLLQFCKSLPHLFDFFWLLLQLTHCVKH